MNKTILYYTSNRENPEFEKKIIDNLLSKSGDIPIISVSQKPMNLGQNICVGEVGQSYINALKQIVIGAKEATTEYLIMAESDFLYTPEYFQFESTGENIYRYDNIWIMWLNDEKRREKYRNFHRKAYSVGAQIVKREFLIDLLEKYLEDFPTWYDRSYRKIKLFRSPYHNVPYTFFQEENPCISIKTKNGNTFITRTKRGAENISKNLPYWGNVKDLRSKFS